MNGSIQSRVVATDLDAWNNSWYVYVATPFLAVLGVVLGSVVDVHVAASDLGQVLVTGLVLGATMLVGYTLLALADRRANGG
jgi:FtsH-binding integral membrane protein